MSSIIDWKDLYYRNLNRRIRVAFLKGHREIVLKNVLGQRYIGGGLNHRGRIFIEGTPGQDMGAFMNGPEIIVMGNAQDGVANTMNAGKIVVRGKAKKDMKNPEDFWTVVDMQNGHEPEQERRLIW